MTSEYNKKQKKLNIEKAIEYIKRPRFPHRVTDWVRNKETGKREKAFRFVPVQLNHHFIKKTFNLSMAELNNILRDLALPTIEFKRFNKIEMPALG